MAMQTTSQLLYDGQRNVVMQFTGLSDGGNETLAVKVDVSELEPVPRSVKIVSIEYEVSGGIVQLFWDALDPLKFLELSGVGSFDYETIGGMVNGAGSSADVTGDMRLSTVGFDAGSSYSFKLEMKKKY